MTTSREIDAGLQAIVSRAGREAGRQFDAAQLRRDPELQRRILRDTTNRVTEVLKLANEAFAGFGERMAIAIGSAVVGIYGDAEQREELRRINR